MCFSRTDCAFLLQTLSFPPFLKTILCTKQQYGQKNLNPSNWPKKQANIKWTLKIPGQHLCQDSMYIPQYILNPKRMKNKRLTRRLLVTWSFPVPGKGPHFWLPIEEIISCWSSSMFIYSFLTAWVFVAARGLSLVVESWGSSLAAVHRLLTAVTCPVVDHWLWAQWASVVAAQRLSSWGPRALEHGLSSCGSWARLFHCMWNLPGPGIEPVSPASTGRFPATEPPGKPLWIIFFKDTCKVGYL